MPTTPQVKNLRYQFIDKTGHCFRDWSNTPCKIKYYKIIGSLLQASNKGKRVFAIEDMLNFRKDLEKQGFKMYIDFDIRGHRRI